MKRGTIIRASVIVVLLAAFVVSCERLVSGGAPTPRDIALAGWIETHAPTR